MYAEPNRVSLYEAVASGKALQTTSPRTSGQPFKKRSQRQSKELNAKARRNSSMQRTPGLKAAMGEIEPTAHTLP